MAKSVLDKIKDKSHNISDNDIAQFEKFIESMKKNLSKCYTLNEVEEYKIALHMRKSENEVAARRARREAAANSPFKIVPPSWVSKKWVEMYMRFPQIKNIEGTGRGRPSLSSVGGQNYIIRKWEKDADRRIRIDDADISGLVLGVNSFMEMLNRIAMLHSMSMSMEGQLSAITNKASGMQSAARKKVITYNNLLAGVLGHMAMSEDESGSYNIYMDDISETLQNEEERYLRLKYKKLSDEWLSYKRRAGAYLGHWAATGGLIQGIIKDYVKARMKTHGGLTIGGEGDSTSYISKLVYEVEYSGPSKKKYAKKRGRKKKRARDAQGRFIAQDTVAKIIDNKAADYLKLNQWKEKTGRDLEGDMESIITPFIMEILLKRFLCFTAGAITSKPRGRSF